MSEKKTTPKKRVALLLQIIIALAGLAILGFVGYIALFVYAVGQVGWR